MTFGALWVDCVGCMGLPYSVSEYVCVCAPAVRGVFLLFSFLVFSRGNFIPVLCRMATLTLTYAPLEKSDIKKGVGCVIRKEGKSLGFALSKNRAIGETETERAKCQPFNFRFLGCLHHQHWPSKE